MVRKTGTDNVYEYKNAKGEILYRINYRVFDPRTGAKTAQRTKSGFKSKSEAKSYLIKMEYEVRAGTYVDAKKTILAEYLRDWIESRKREIRKNTYDGYKVNIEHHIISNIGKMKLQNIRRIDIENLYTKLLKSGRHDGKGGLSSTSVLYIHRVLKCAFNYAMRDELIAKNPMEWVKAPKKAKFKATRLPLKELWDMVELAKGMIMEVPIVLAGMLGLRRGEILGLKWNDIDFETGEIVIDEQVVEDYEDSELKESKEDIGDTIVIGELKTERSNRTLIAPTFILKILKEQRTRQLERRIRLGRDYNKYNLVNCTLKGDMYDPGQFSHMFEAFLKTKKLNPIRFHDLRHTAAQNWRELGFDIKDISDNMGHSDIGTTVNTYMGVSNKRMESLSKKLDLAVQGIIVNG